MKDVILFALILILSFSANGNDKHLKIGVLHFPPFYVVEEDREVSGVYIEILKKVLDRAGYSYTIDGFPPKRFYSQLGDNTTNFFLGVKGSKYIEGKVEYGELEFEGIQLRAYSTSEKNVISSKDELKEKRLIVIRGFGYGGLAKFVEDPANEILAVETNDHFTAFKMLMNRRGDYLLDYKVTSDVVMNELGLKNISYGVLMQAHTYFIINKKFPHYLQVLEDVEKAYLELVSLGAIEDIRVVKN